ncbi:MAG: isoaspartyl peptidase/L-asparaginase [Bradymonadaceae bacterium]|nr:isoaspartyl peptidase/L-asparaginase [Lujinxingiaceae bacterium]
MIIPRVIIHGGAGRALKSSERAASVQAALYAVLDEIHQMLVGGASAVDAVVHGCRLLEDDSNFNAGTGSVLQSDGQIRMSAALMDGERQCFSGVINVARVQNPIDLASVLQGGRDHVLSDLGAMELARELNLPVYDPLIERRLSEWLEQRGQDRAKPAADVVGAGSEHGSGTIGVVAFDTHGRLAAGTSTGGRGFERVGRVSDSAMPAGNYATQGAAISCTGIGEDIIDECLAARISVRVDDGMSLHEAFARSFAEASRRKRNFGAIGIDARGTIAWGKTSEILLAAYTDGQSRADTLGLELGMLVESLPMA